MSLENIVDGFKKAASNLTKASLIAAALIAGGASYTNTAYAAGDNTPQVVTTTPQTEEVKKIVYDGITYYPISNKQNEQIYVPEPFTPQNIADLIYKRENELKVPLLETIKYDYEGIKETTIKEIKPALTKTQYIQYLQDVYRKTAEGKKGLPSTKEELEEWFQKYGPIVYAVVGPGDPKKITTKEGKQITLITPISEIQPGYIWGMAAKERTETSEVVEVGMTYTINEEGTKIKQVTLKTNNEKPKYGRIDEKLLKRNEIEDIFWGVEEMRGYGNEYSEEIAASLFNGTAYIPIGILEKNGIGYAYPTAPIPYDIRHLEE